MKETKTEIKKTEIQIDNETFFFEDMTQEQQVLVNHLADLDRKISSSQFNLEQLSVGKNAFINLLKEALVKDK
jgi:uncharacterized protein (DUF1697 family)